MTRPPMVRGEAHGSAKLTEADVIWIRAVLRVGTYSLRQLAEHYKVSHTAIRRAAQGRTWRHVR